MLIMVAGLLTVTLAFLSPPLDQSMTCALDQGIHISCPCFQVHLLPGEEPDGPDDIRGEMDHHSRPAEAYDLIMGLNI